MVPVMWIQKNESNAQLGLNESALHVQKESKKYQTFQSDWFETDAVISHCL